jgi:hypothetical protein
MSPVVWRQQRDATTRDAFFDRSAWRAVRLQHGLFSFISTSVARQPDHSNPPASLATLLQFSVVVAGRFFDLDAHLFDTRFDVSSCTEPSMMMVFSL